MSDIKKFKVRPAQFADFKKIRDYDDFLGDRRLDIQRGELIVAALQDDFPIGFAKIDSGVFLNRILLEIVCVTPAWRRHKVASALIAHACSVVAPQCIYATTEESNTAMRNCLLSLGWAQVGYIDEYNFSGEREIILRGGSWPPQF